MRRPGATQGHKPLRAYGHATVAHCSGVAGAIAEMLGVHTEDEWCRLEPELLPSERGQRMSDDDDGSSCDGCSAPLSAERPCEWPGRRAPAEPPSPSQRHGSCPERCDGALEKQLLGEYAKWDGSSQPEREFLHLFARYVCRGGNILGVLTNGKLGDTAYGLEKTGEGLEFRIARDRGAWGVPESVPEVEQRWALNLATRELRLLEERSSV